LLNIKKILLPLDLEESHLPLVLIHQAAALARHFHAEVLVLHVVRPFTYIAGSEAAKKLLDEALAAHQAIWQKQVGSAFDGIPLGRRVLHGDPTREILATAQNESFQLIVMPAHKYGPLEKLLLGSVAAKVIQQSKCPVWVGQLLEEAPEQPFAVRNILCSVDLTTHSAGTIRSAQDFANEFGAQLTLAHVTPGTEIYGPGGYHAIPKMRDELIGAAKQRMAEIQKQLGTSAAVYVDSGDVPKVMSRAVQETKADLLVVGSHYHSSGLGNVGYGIMSLASIPVLTV
jgi:nucleotide-binding universal stress UspA family protein